MKYVNNKANKDLLKEYISFIPTGYNFDNETAKKVFAVLHFYSHLNNHQPFTIGMRTIADDAMISTMTVSRTMKLLIEKYKYVECQKGHLKVNSTYQILSPSTETSIVTSTETSNKNDMLQRDQMLQQNVTTKLIDDVTITYTDNEQVTEVGNEQMLQCVTEGSQKGEMLHKYKYNNKLKHKHNYNGTYNKNSYKTNNTLNKQAVNNNNNSIKVIGMNSNSITKENNKENVSIEMFSSLLEKLVSIQQNTANMLEKLISFEVKCSQLEERVNKQSEQIDYLNGCLTKAREAYRQLREEKIKNNNAIANSPTLVGNTSIEKKQSITLNVTPTPSMVERDEAHNAYKEKISQFYACKKAKDFTSAQVCLSELQKMAEDCKLNSHQLECVKNAKNYLESDLHKQNTSSNATADSTPQPWENDKWRKFCEETAQKWEIAKKYAYQDKLYHSNEFHLTEEILNAHHKLLEVVQVFNSTGKRKQLEAFRSFLAKYNIACLSLKGRAIEIDKLQKHYDNALEELNAHQAKLGSLSVQNEDGGTTVHTEEENRSEGLKSGKNEVFGTNTPTTEQENTSKQPVCTVECVNVSNSVSFKSVQPQFSGDLEAEVDKLMANHLPSCTK